jgi:hypothetical protein
MIITTEDEPEDIPSIWIQKNGIHIEIADMTDDHIRNCVLLLNNKINRWQRSLLAFQYEQTRREKNKP